jgi:hypothetical protein
VLETYFGTNRELSTSYFEEILSKSFSYISESTCNTDLAKNSRTPGPLYAWMMVSPKPGFSPSSSVLTGWKTYLLSSRHHFFNVHKENYKKISCSTVQWLIDHKSVFLQSYRIIWMPLFKELTIISKRAPKDILIILFFAQYSGFHVHAVCWFSVSQTI